MTYSAAYDLSIAAHTVLEFESRVLALESVTPTDAAHAAFIGERIAARKVRLDEARRTLDAAVAAERKARDDVA